LEVAASMAAAKRARTEAPAVEEDWLQTGVKVLFYGDRKGTVRDAFAPLDEFWIEDDSTGQLVRDDGGEIVRFRASELAPVPAPVKEKKERTASCARVLVLGTEQQMLAIMHQFGAPDVTQRHDPQQLLAFPCSACQCAKTCARFDPFKHDMCDKEACPMFKLAEGGISDDMLNLAREQRPDIKVGVRPFHLKQALEQMGPDLLRLEDYYCLSTVTIPFGLEEIEAGSEVQRHYMQEVRCQIDLGASAEGLMEDQDASLEATAERALGEACGICLSRSIFSEDAQLQIRKRLGVDTPVKFWDGADVKVFVIILPRDAIHGSVEGLLNFSSASSGLRRSSKGKAESQGQVRLKTSSGEKSLADWQDSQGQFAGLHKLPADWIRVKSRKSKEIYYFNTKTKKSSFDMPLPPGWTKETSKSSGKAYYFHQKKRKSQFHPPEPGD